jgi:hypothetical protein
MFAASRGGFFTSNRVPMTSALQASILADALNDAYVPTLGPLPGTPAIESPGDYPEEVALNNERLQIFSKPLPFDKYQMRTIITNMTVHEALNARKSSDRLAALSMLGKSSAIDYFAAEKKEITVSTPEALRESINERLERLFGTESVIEAEFSESR